MYEDGEMDRFYAYNLMTAGVTLGELAGNEKPVLQEGGRKGMKTPGRRTPPVNILQHMNSSSCLTAISIIVCIAAIVGLISISSEIGVQVGNRPNTLANNTATTSPARGGVQTSGIGDFRPVTASQPGASNGVTPQLACQEVDDLRILSKAEYCGFMLSSVDRFDLVYDSLNMCVFRMKNNTTSQSSHNL